MLQDTGKIVPERLDSAIHSQEVVNREAQKVKSLVAKDFLGIRRQMLSKALKAEIETSDFYQKMVNELSVEGLTLFERLGLSTAGQKRLLAISDNWKN